MEILLTILLYLNQLIVPEVPISGNAVDEFAYKVEPYYAQLGLYTDTGNTSLQSLPAAYWGATVWNDRCTSQVFLSERFTQPGHPFYRTPMWKYILAHEWAHVAQGKHCWNNEAEAELIALAVLAEAGEWGAVTTALKWMIASIADDEVLADLELSPKERAYYQTVELPRPGVLRLLLADDDGVFELRTGNLEAHALWIFINSLPGMNEGTNQSGVLKD